jgi:hypothetical protein
MLRAILNELRKLIIVELYGVINQIRDLLMVGVAGERDGLK